MSYFLVWLIAALFYLFDFYLRVMPNVMVFELKTTFNITKSEIGYMSACYYYAYALMQIPAGILLDKFGLKKNLIIAAILIFFGNLIATYTTAINTLYLSRLLIGIGSSFGFLSCVRIAHNYFATKHLALLVGATSFVGISGALLAGKPLAILLEIFNWRTLMLQTTLISAVFILLFLVFMPNETLNKNKVRINVFKDILFNCNILHYSLIGCLMVVPLAGFSELWGTEFTTLKFDIDKKTAASLVSLAYIGVALGSPTIGMFAKDRATRVLTLKFTTIISLICLLTFIYMQHISPAMFAMLQIVFGFSTSSMLLCFTLNIEAMPKHQSFVVGFTNTIVTIGSVTSQPLIGYILDNSKSSYYKAFIPLILASISAVYLTIFSRNCKNEKTYI